MTEDETITEERRAGKDRRSPPSPQHDPRFLFDVFKWVAALIVAVIGIYVISERRAATSDLTATYLDKKADQITAQMEKQSAQINGRLDGLAQAVQNVAAANSGMQSELNSLKEKINDLKTDYKAADEMLKGEQSALRSQLADIKAKVR